MLDGLLNFLGASGNQGGKKEQNIGIDDLKDLKMSVFAKPITLIGMPGSGKTSVGRELAKKLSCNFIDLDTTIEKFTGKKIAEIFEQSGEKKFREIERDALEKAVAENSNKKVVISLGGGTPCGVWGMEFIQKNTISFFIDVLPEEIIERLEKSPNQRPLIGSDKTKLINNIYKLYNERYDFYTKAQFRVNGSVLAEEVANKIVGVLNFI